MVHYLFVFVCILDSKSWMPQTPFRTSSCILLVLAYAYILGVRRFANRMPQIYFIMQFYGLIHSSTSHHTFVICEVLDKAHTVLAQ